MSASSRTWALFANPVSAARATTAIAQQLGLRGLKIAAVTGDDVLGDLKNSDRQLDIGCTVDGLARQPNSFRQRLSRRRFDRSSPARWGRCRHHRAGRRSLSFPRSVDPRVRLGDGRLAVAGKRHSGRPSSGVRGSGHRRIFCRSRIQGRQRLGPSRLSDRRSSGRRGFDRHQGGGFRGACHGRDGQGAIAL